MSDQMKDKSNDTDLMLMVSNSGNVSYYMIFFLLHNKR